MIRLGFVDSMRVLKGGIVSVLIPFNPPAVGRYQGRHPLGSTPRGFLFYDDATAKWQVVYCPYGKRNDVVEVHLSFWARLLMGAILPKFRLRYIQISQDPTSKQYEWHLTLERQDVWTP